MHARTQSSVRDFVPVWNDGGYLAAAGVSLQVLEAHWTTGLTTSCTPMNARECCCSGYGKFIPMFIRLCQCNQSILAGFSGTLLKASTADGSVLSQFYNFLSYDDITAATTNASGSKVFLGTRVCM
jgi:hypothetical protein